jgi:diguanylate cyclase (GGDEF)-like protein
VSPDPLLLAAIRAVARSEDPDATLDELLEIGLRATGAERAAAFLWVADQGGLVLAASRGYATDAAPALESLAATVGGPIQLAAQERIEVTGEADADGRVLSAWPIVVGRDGIEEPIGALALESDDAPDATTVDWVAALGDLIAVVVDRARMAEHAAERIDWAERVSNSDMLTGLANARTLSRVLELELARAARQAAEVTVALFDVDGLAAFNDAHGRAAGDDVLREVAAVLGESVRFVDTVARWGGDEFMLVAPGARGTTVARRIVEAVAARDLTEGRRATVSAGLARFPADGTSSDRLIEAATSALQAARAVGPGTLAEATADRSPDSGNGSGQGIVSGAAGS